MIVIHGSNLACKDLLVFIALFNKHFLRKMMMEIYIPYWHKSHLIKMFFRINQKNKYCYKILYVYKVTKGKMKIGL